MYKDKPIKIKVKSKVLNKILESPVLSIVRNWLFQGILYMDIFELTLKLMLTLFISVIIIVFQNDYSLGFIVTAIIFSHSVNWLINGHIFVLLRYFGYKCKIWKKEKYIKQLQDRYSSKRCIRIVAIYGGYSRGNFSDYSDIDVRCISEDSLIYHISAAILTLYERSRALIFGIPLDIYTYANINVLSKTLRKDEIPVVLKDKYSELTVKK